MAGATEQVRESWHAVKDVFRNPSLRRINLALAGSLVGDAAQFVAFAVLAYEIGGAGLVGAFSVARYLVSAVFGPFVAVLADRFDRRRVMIAADVARAALTTGAAVLVFADAPILPVFLLFMFTSLLGTLFRPAQAALLPSLADSPGELTAANAAALTIHSMSFFVGPAIGGALLAFTQPAWAFVFNAATFLWSALMVLGVRPHAPVADDVADADHGVEDDNAGGGGGMFAGLGDGYRAIFASRDLRLLVGLYFLQTVIAGASAVYEVAIALDLLDLGNGGLGLLGFGLGLGGIVGGAIALVLAQGGGLARNFGFGIILWGAPLLLVSAFPSVVTALIAMAAIGLGNSIVDVSGETILQRLTPDAVMGRVFGALDSAAIGGMALGSALMPVMINTIGLRWGLTVLGVAIPLIVLASAAGLRRIDRVALAPEGLELVRAVPMLGVLPEHLVERLARSAVEVTVPAGAAVFHEGDAGDRFYVIEHGTFDVIKGGVVVNHLGPGDSFGEIALIRDVPRTATVVAATDASLRAVDRRHFLPAVTGHDEAHQQAELIVNRFTSMS
ncbi:MAG: MFS transporter [Ilumatobacteraceae bacterium]